MRGVGGPLLCISDLLNDIGEEKEEISAATNDHAPPPSIGAASNFPKLFQQSLDKLNTALEQGTDHSWTALTLELCSALETANKLVDSSNSHVAFLAEKVEELERTIDRRDTAVKAVQAIQASLHKL